MTNGQQAWKKSLQEIREQQVEDFRLTMLALSQVQNGLGGVQEGLQRVQQDMVKVRAGLEKHQEYTSAQLDVLQSAIPEDLEEQLDDIRRRLDRLE
ncbi:MAG: hypothetical protein AB1758_12120, partial [Candidatus Eremiobacterota bacterium]